MRAHLSISSAKTLGTRIVFVAEFFHLEKRGFKLRKELGEVDDSIMRMMFLNKIQYIRKYLLSQ